MIGHKPLDEIGTPDVLTVLAPIWTTKPETARRVKQRIGLVLDWARATGHRSGDNPVQLLGDALPKHKATDEHRAALPYARVPEFIARLRAGRAEPISKLALEFMILTAVRSKEVRGAKWTEFDLEAATWTIPGDDGKGRRMKAGREHIVPLSTRALAILTEAHTLISTSDLVFPDRATGRLMSENRLLVVRDGLGYSRTECTPHGFRSSLRDWAAEETSFPSEVAEMALAHAIKSKIEAAYRRGQLLAKRRELMEAWAAFRFSGDVTIRGYARNPLSNARFSCDIDRNSTASSRVPHDRQSWLRAESGSRRHVSAACTASGGCGRRSMFTALRSDALGALTICGCSIPIAEYAEDVQSENVRELMLRSLSGDELTFAGPRRLTGACRRGETVSHPEDRLAPRRCSASTRR